MIEKEKITLIEGETYTIEGLPMIYQFSENSRNFFQKVDESGNPKGRLRVIIGDPDHVARILARKYSRS